MKYLFILFLASAHLLAFSQTGSVTGKVISSVNSDPLIGATVAIKGTSRVTKTDVNGNYNFSSLKPGTYSLLVSYVSFQEKTMSDIRIEPGEVFIQNITLEPKGSSTTDVVIRSSRVNRENIATLLVAQKNSASVSDGISAEVIKRTPDKNTSDILKRVSGASIQEDKFAIIRGLNDRYNVALLNGAILPSTESDRKAFSFDIFPANMLDNLVIYKTATPDLPGELGGGAILINTKDIPSRNFESFSLSLGYNTLATFKERLYYPGGRLDFLGLDDGKRALSAKIPPADRFPTNPNQRIFLGFNIPNDWRIIKGSNFLNTGLQYVKGYNYQRKGNDFLGILFSVSYNRTYTANTGTRRSNDYDRLNPSDSSILRGKYDEQFFVAQTLAGAIGNVSLKLNANHVFNFKNILSINSDDRVILRSGVNDITSDPDAKTRSTARWFTSNVIYAGQLSGDHYWERTKLRFNWLAAFTTVRREIPNLRKTIYATNGIDTIFRASVPALIPEADNGGSIFYSTSSEVISNLKFDVQRTFKTGRFTHLFKTGLYYQDRSRVFNARLLGLVKYAVPGRVTFDNNLLSLPEDRLFSYSSMGLFENGKGGFILGDATKPSDRYTASSILFAGYLMMDQRLGKWVRLIYGARMENFNQKVYSLFSVNDTVRINTNKIDYLPSASLIFSLSSKMNLRFCYSKTLNRPEYRELAPFAFYDFVTRYTISGSPFLKRAVIDNYDFRYEYYPGRGQLLSFSLFYKKFINPIEQATVLGTDRQIIYTNAPAAENRGLELEFRSVLGSLFQSADRSLLNNLTLFSNIAVVQSKVTLTLDTITANLIRTRPLQGQSPYVFNAGLTYLNDKNGISLTVSGNRIGQRIFIVGDENQMDVWENGRTVIDVQLSKNFTKGKLKNLEAKLNIKDILAQRLIFFEDINDNKKYSAGVDNIWSTTNFGRTISLNLSYRF